jgi:cytochrome P450
MALFIQTPGASERVRQDPTLIPNAVEEILRLETPSTSIWRITTQATTLGDVAIPAGSVVNLRFDAANRDEAMFLDPDQFDMTRGDARKHVSFGTGIHTCLGHALARKELVIAFTKLFARLKNIEIDYARTDLNHKPSLLLRVKRALHIRFERA